jgi:hypothetical protein
LYVYYFVLTRWRSLHEDGQWNKETTPFVSISVTILLKKKGWCNYYWDETSSQDNTELSCPEVKGLQHSGYTHYTANSVNLVCGTPINILWGIDWLTCHKSMKYTCVIQFKLYLPRYARSQIPTYKLCLIVIRSKYATHIHHVFKNCLLRCARFAIYYTLAHSMFHRLLKIAFFVLLYGFFFLLLRPHILNKYFIIMYLMLFWLYVNWCN